ncbi:hypothetical protein [Hymenobacter sp. PAMC 26628]|uniref:hypothetical protein n=1 Tax=Hymenobacter sp. PAMC 26628 TaxID=1484118 RepID=UPI00090203B2
MGPSGAGKSALLATLAGTLTANPGRVVPTGLAARWRAPTPQPIQPRGLVASALQITSRWPAHRRCAGT